MSLILPASMFRISTPSPLWRLLRRPVATGRLAARKLAARKLAIGQLSNVSNASLVPLLMIAMVIGWADAVSARVPVVRHPIAAAVVQEHDEPTSIPTMTEQEAVEFFELQVKPILTDKCFRCHSAAEINGSLKLTSRQAILQGGDSGPAVDLESIEDSILLSAINYDDYEMPPTGKLSDAQIQAITTWVQLGMPWTPGEEEIEFHASHPIPQVNDQSKAWWSYQKVSRPAVPEVHLAVPGSASPWAINAIDHFVAAKLSEKNLSPNPEADRRTLIRRAYYDLLGLPPSKQQVDQFVNDPDPLAYEKLIDQLLLSPHYGEKWGRFWLDLVRYSETNSFERDGDKPFVWQYRDYVIQSLNADKPYDQFLIEQLAGDEIASPNIETYTATGYYRLGQWDDEPADPELARLDDLDDILRTTSEVMLGMTVGCARCHDHKIDPIPQTDYYRFLAAFNNIQRYGVRSNESVEEASVRSFELPMNQDALSKHQQEMERVEAGLAQIFEKVKDDFQAVEHEEWQYEENHVRLIKARQGGVLSEREVRRFERMFARRQELRDTPPKNERKVLSVKEQGAQPRDCFVMVRGNAHVTGEQVTAGFPSVLSPPEPEIVPPANGESSGQRLALARWIASPENPLTARVIVNRIWQGHFGRGIVRTSSDFGFQGSPPTHPELLDWLASELVANDWKLKPLHRAMMLSRTYRMSSANNETAYAQDPANDLLWRYDLRRLTAEEIRDSILAANGHLNLEEMFGPSIFPVMPQEVLAGQSQPGQGWGQSSQAERDRRSVYIKMKRSLKLPILQNFDAPESDFSCAVRFNTTQPTQALGMLNSEFVNIEAGRMAKKILETVDPSDTAGQVRTVLEQVTQREPLPAELSVGVDFIQRMKSEEGLDSHQALSKFCLLGLNLNEFIYLE